MNNATRDDQMKKHQNTAVYLIIGILAITTITTALYLTNNKSHKKPVWIKSGNYDVGKDLLEGEYVLISKGENSKYEIFEDEIVVSKDIIYGQSYIRIKKGQTLKFIDSEMCKADEAPRLNPDDETYKQGMYKVGRDVTPGEYVLHSKSSGYYVVLSDVTGDIDSIIENENFVGEKSISLKSGQYIKIIGATMKSKQRLFKYAVKDLKPIYIFVCIREI